MLLFFFSSFFFPSPLVLSTSCIQQQTWLLPFSFPHDYSLNHKAGPGLPSDVLDCTKYPTEGKTGVRAYY
ncbi:hypothetical protein XELAEV_18035810mg [Xenopus laevis]|uniref:Secreted protein n=1 Tax=Xenopus laevis TaxID=8355 RepID=A0A974HCH1_XENLA|nr:hypothetical protein XELAEV_18035810mg [Xenopus laevis]